MNKYLLHLASALLVLLSVPAQAAVAVVTPPPIFDTPAVVANGDSFVDQYGNNWDLATPEVKDSTGTVLATGSQVTVATSPSTKMLVAYQIAIPDASVPGQFIYLSNVVFGCRPDLGQDYSTCDGMMSFEFDTTNNEWRLVTIVDAHTMHAYADQSAAANNYGAALKTSMIFGAGDQTWTMPLSTTTNMGATIAYVLSKWNWAKY